jgi:hypothetical protein
MPLHGPRSFYGRHRGAIAHGDLYQAAAKSRDETVVALEELGELQTPEMRAWLRGLAGIIRQIRTRDWMEAIGSAPELDPPKDEA